MTIQEKQALYRTVRQEIQTCGILEEPILRFVGNEYDSFRGFDMLAIKVAVIDVAIILHDKNVFYHLVDDLDVR